MPRQTKYRAWDKKSKKMRRVYSISFDELTGLPKVINVWGFDIIEDKQIILHREDDAILLEYTGLKDKKCTEIYEGDLLRFPANNKWEETNYSCFEVFFHDGNANSDYNIGYSMARMHNHGSICGGYIPAFKPRNVEDMIIIGNIYEQSQPLKNNATKV